MIKIAVHLLSLHLGPSEIIKRELLPLGYVLDGKHGQVVDVLVGVVADACEDAHVGVARVVDETGRSGHKLAVDFERGAFEARV